MKLYFFGIISMIMLVGCESNKREEYVPYTGSSVPLISVNSLEPRILDWDNAEEVKFEDIIEEIRYIPLGDEEDVMGQIDQILYNDGIFYLFDKNHSIIKLNL